MNFETLKWHTTNGPSSSQTGWLTISRPESLNALNAQLIGELGQCLVEISKLESLRAVVVTGAGEKSFVAGADIKEMKDHSSSEALKMSERGQKVFDQLAGLEIPTVCAVNGFALGGGLELALSCDILMASSKAKWGLPEVTLGLIPGYGGTQRLARALGPSLAKRVTFSGEIFSAEQGLNWGLFAGVFEPDQLLGEAQKLANTLSERSPVAIRIAKKAIDLGLDQSLAKGLEIERELFSQTFAAQDHNEGILAFIEKRKPVFKGN